MNNYYTIIINDANACDTVYTYLKSSGYSENYLKNLRKQLGYIILNDKPVFITEKVKNGDLLKINVNPNKKTLINSCNIPLQILYEDDYLIAVYKPSGLATMPTRSHYTENLSGAIVNYMKNKDKNFVVRILNRLDKDTSGIILIAKDSITCNFMNRQKINKTYYALLCGKIEKYTVINKGIATLKDNNGINNKMRVVTESGKTATTCITPIKYIINKNEDYTYCKINLVNGRTHQIRVHSAYISHPLLGDNIYGTKSELIEHFALICKKVSFVHPITKKTITIECEYPKEFNILINV